MTGRQGGIRRREWLRRVAGLGAVSVAGCLESIGVGGGGSGGGSPPGSDGGWQQFRRDAWHTGIAPADAGPGDELESAWTFELPSLVSDSEASVATRATGSPVFLDGRVVVAASLEVFTESSLERREYLLGLDPETGEIAWQQKWETTPGSSNVVDPVVVDGSVVAVRYAQSAGESVFAVVDPASGDVTDEHRTEGPVSTVSAGPAGVYAWGTTTVFALDPADWSRRWTWSTGDNYASPADHLTVHDGRVLVTLGNEFVALDAEGGDVVWRNAPEILGTVHAETPMPFAEPTVVDGTAYAAGSIDTIAQRSRAGIVAFDPASGEEHWRFTPPVEGVGSVPEENAVAVSAVYGHPIVLEDTVYVTGHRSIVLQPDGQQPMQPLSGTRSVFALDAAAGDLREEREAPVAFAPVAAGDTVYLPGGEGLAAYGTSLDRVGSAEVSASVARSPALGAGLLFVPTHQGLVALGGSA